MDNGSDKPMSQAAKLYPLQPNDEYGIIVGLSDTGQYLFKRDDCSLLIVLFGQDGTLVDYKVESFNGSDDIDIKLNSIRNREGMREQAIHVRRFSLPEHAVEIHNLPSHLRRFIADPDLYVGLPEGAVKQREMDSLRSSLDEWQASGMFVLVWDDEYWMNSDGTVEAH
jgi:hypothetical protein